MPEKQHALLGVDIGTTHIKAGLFVQAEHGLSTVALAHRDTVTRRGASGFAYFDPQELWDTVVSAMSEVQAQASGSASDTPVAAVGIASMAETGLLIDLKSGQARSPLLPWFDTSANQQAERMVPRGDAALRQERFRRSGIYPSFKASLAKILWLRKQDESQLVGATWLGTADYIAYRLTGQAATDYSLAGRTYAFDLSRLEWDAEWLRHLGLSPDLFPPAHLSGTPVGKVCTDGLAGLRLGTPVAVAGHDHVCAAFALGAADPGLVFDSMGTAETLMGALESRPLSATEYGAGLSFGHHVTAGRLYWMGGLSSSGGSVDWLRSLVSDPPLSYSDLEQLLGAARPGPTGIVYLPYLAGSGSPHTDPLARAALVGLTANHGRADVAKAVLEGAAYELEVIRRAARAITGSPVSRVVAAGGGTRNRAWMQVKADVFGVPVDVTEMSEATLLGAALRAGVGIGLYSSGAEALANRPRGATGTYKPDPVNHGHYQDIYENGFLPLQEPVRRYARWLGAEGVRR